MNATPNTELPHPSSELSAPSSARSAHWVVKMNHRNRSVALLVGGLTIATHLSSLDAEVSAWTWGVLTLNFGLYPHLLYLYAKRTASPFEAEMRNIYLDALTFGLWLGFLGFPLWLALMFTVGSTMNPTIFRGVKGLMRGVSLMICGALIGAALGGFQLSLETSVTPALLSLSATLYFLISVAFGANKRLLKLHHTRQALKERESTLQEKLNRINSLELKLKELAVRDVLTGLYTRRFLEPTLERELTRSQREGQPISLLMIELDHYTHLTHVHGHDELNRSLCALAELISERVRCYDLVARYSAAQFVLLLSGVPEGKALERAEHLKEQWQERYQVLGVCEGETSTLSMALITLTSQPQSEQKQEQAQAQAQGHAAAQRLIETLLSLLDELREGEGGQILVER